MNIPWTVIKCWHGSASRELVFPEVRINVDENEGHTKERSEFFQKKEAIISRVLIGRLPKGPNSTMSLVKKLTIIFLVFTAGNLCHATGIGNGFYSETNGANGSSRLECPLCDSSVYSYCSEKLLHDACCCLNPYEHKLPHQCKYADCGFLHANSCREHKLITACCCIKLL